MIYTVKLNNDIIINYTESDLNYINEIIEYFKSKYSVILDFFEISKLDKPLQINIWNDSNDFVKELTQITGYEFPFWATGSAKNDKTDEYSRVDYLSLREIRKIDYHKNETVEDMKKGIVHEFVHVCHSQSCKYNYPKKSYKSEGVATYLADQYDDASISTSIDKILEDKEYVEYENYRALFDKLVDTLPHEQLLDFINSSNDDFDNEIMSSIINNSTNTKH